MCHGKMGEGDGPADGAFQTDSPALAKRLDPSQQNAMVRVILDGRGDMPSFSQTFGKEDAKRILKWLEDPKPVREPKSKDDQGNKKKKDAKRRRKKRE